MSGQQDNGEPSRDMETPPPSEFAEFVTEENINNKINDIQNEDDLLDYEPDEPSNQNLEETVASFASMVQ